MKQRDLYCKLVEALMEKHGLEVSVSHDKREIFIGRLQKSLLFTELESIIRQEELDSIIHTIEPHHYAAWILKIV